MTKRDFEKVARALASIKDKCPEPEWNYIQGTLADVFAASNNRFDPAKFRRACTLTPAELNSLLGVSGNG